MAPTCPVPGPGVIQGRGNIGLLCENLIKEMIGDIGFTLVGLYIKGMLAVQSFAVSRNLLALGAVVSPSPQMPEHEEYRKENNIYTILIWTNK